MALGDLFASTRNRSPLQVAPLGQLPSFVTGGGTLDTGGTSGTLGTGGDTTLGNGDTTPEFGEIPQNVQELLALFGEGDVASLAGMSGEQIAKFFGLSSESAQFFQPVQTGLLGEALGAIGEERTFGLGQAEDILQIGTTQARQRFGVQAAGLRTGLLGLAQQVRRGQAAAGFAGAGAGQVALGAGRRQAEQRLGQFAGARRTGLQALQERFQTTQAGVQTTARSGIQGLLSQIAQQVGGFGATAADLTAAEAAPPETRIIQDLWQTYASAGGTLNLPEWIDAGRPGVGDEGAEGAVFGPGQGDGTSDGQISTDGNFVWRFGNWIPR